MMDAIKIQDLIEVSFLQELQDNFASSTGVASLIQDNCGRVLTHPSCFSDFCLKLIRSSPKGLKRCEQTEINGIKNAAHVGKPVIYQCHAGLIDFAAPIMVEGRLIGGIFGGQVLFNPPEMGRCRQVSRELGIEFNSFMEAIEKIPIFPQKRVEAASKLLFSVANSLSKCANQTLKIEKINREIVLTYNRLENIFNIMSDGVVITDFEGSVQQINKVIEELFKKPAELLIKKTIHELIGVQKPFKFIEDLFNKKNYYNDIEIFIDTDQGRVHCLSSGRPIFDDKGNLSGGLIIFKPIKKVQKLVNRLSGAQASFKFEDIIGQSLIIKKVIKLAAQAAVGTANIMIEGESGVGKEVFAQAIHNGSPRANEPFVAVNCGAIPRELVSSELFGYIEGAFTGAKRGGRPGKFEFASGGTIFLDEIGDMPLEVQVTLLRVIQERVLTRIGDNKLIPVDLRIICATNKNLELEVQKGNFRQDLYYRLNVISLKIPSLRERPGDIPLIFSHMLKSTGQKWGRTFEEIDPQIIALFQKYNWPGNVREMQNVVERIISIAQGDKIQVDYLPENIVNYKIHSAGTALKPCLTEQQHSEERQNIINFLIETKGNISLTAKKLGFSRSTIYRKMRQYNISY